MKEVIQVKTIRRTVKVKQRSLGRGFKEIVLVNVSEGEKSHWFVQSDINYKHSKHLTLEEALGKIGVSVQLNFIQPFRTWDMESAYIKIAQYKIYSHPECPINQKLTYKNERGRVGWYHYFGFSQFKKDR